MPLIVTAREAERFCSASRGSTARRKNACGRLSCKRRETRDAWSLDEVAALVRLPAGPSDGCVPWAASKSPPALGDAGRAKLLSWKVAPCVLDVGPISAF